MNFGDFDLFTLVGYSFVRKNAKINNQMIVGKNFKVFKTRPTPTFYLNSFKSYKLS